MNTWFGLLKLAFSNLRINKTRSFLTMLGMIFGTGAVIATLSSSEGSKKFLEEELKKLGGNLLVIHSSRTSNQERERDLLLKYSPYLSSVSAVLSGPDGFLSYGSRNAKGQASGIEFDFLTTRNTKLDRGRFFDRAERDGFVAVLGGSAKRELFGKNNAIGENIFFNFEKTTYSFEVIGVLKEKGGSEPIDRSLLIPLALATKIFPKDSKPTVYATLFHEKDYARAKSQIKALLKTKDKSAVSEAREMIEQNQRISEKQNMVGLVLALISLITGGVGIMNIMLLSITQRRKEIGLRKAVGANDFHIVAQFLLEAVILCLAGGIIGILAGMGFGQQVAHRLGNWDAVVSPWAISLAIIFSLATGIVFGILPAVRAAELDPYEALRA